MTVPFQIEPKEGKKIKNGPGLIGFREGPAEYMLFLTRLPDGRYQCVSGQFDPYLSVLRPNHAAWWMAE
jgi:hypothetical protein